MGPPTTLPARSTPGQDGATALTVYLVLLLAIPARYVIGPLGAAGTPAQVFAMALTLWWLGHKLASTPAPETRSKPVRLAMLLFLAAATVSYVAANLRPIAGAELRAADRGMLTLLALLGVVLVAGDLIPTRARLDALLRRVVLAGAAVASLGLVQFQTGRSFVEYLRLPGLTLNSELYNLSERAGFLRPASTAVHPIEFGVAIAMLLPLAMHYALTDGHRHWLPRWYPVLAIGLAVPVSVSRSAVVAIVIVLAIMLPVMSRRARQWAYVAAVGLAGVIYVSVPGMLGTIVKLFTGIATDNSAASRTDSYGLALEFITNAPVFGRGFATFLPEYRILDNQFLLTTIELGLVGLAAFLGLLLTAASTAIRVRRRAIDTVTRQLSTALLASLAAGAATFALFDAFSFPMVAGLTFLVIGAISGLYRISPIRPAGSTEPPVAKVSLSKAAHLAPAGDLSRG